MRMGPAFVVISFLLFAFAAKPLPRVSAAAAPETDDYEQSDGLPLKFIPANSKKGVVRLSTDLNIKFSGPASCSPSAVWKVENYDDLTGQMFISTSGVEGNPGPETLDNWFKIERDIGIYVDSEGFRRLALSDVPFKVMFKKF
ncbi:hypothetical protein OIU84_014383 [Salix udensis]|uniref:Uncharacterized protein n=1 Tax=Salix udensis TaxID=889485 RepID=A0AAD6NQZ7_9ROSI|nr:hypothetical protein OIU84_014383 [Salix udensis]